MKYTYIFANKRDDCADPPYFTGIKANSMEEAVRKYLSDYEYPEGVIEETIQDGIWYSTDCFFESGIEEFCFSVQRIDYFMENSIRE